MLKNLSHENALELVRSLRYMGEKDETLLKLLYEKDKELGQYLLAIDDPGYDDWTFNPEKFGALMNRLGFEVGGGSTSRPTDQLAGYKATQVEKKIIEDLKKKCGIESTSELLRVSVMEKADRDL